MPNPKRRFSKARHAKKRTHKKLEPTFLSTCSHCGRMKKPHRVCPHCGYYKGKEVISVKKKEKKKKS